MSRPARHPIDRATIAKAIGTSIAGRALEDAGRQSPDFAVGPTYARATVTAPATPPLCRLPDFYELLPSIVRQMDTTLVDRGSVTLYPWDQIPDWDVSPYSWDDLIGPETILKSTIRVIQNEFEISNQEVCGLKDLATHLTAPAEYLPIISAGLGMPLPSVPEAAQRVFIDSLVRWYRRKGTPLVFRALFRNLGFDLTLIERYQRKKDAALAPGPDIRFVQSDGIVGIEAGTLTATNGPYYLAAELFPIARRSVYVYVYDQSEVTPTVLRDDGEGGWEANASGSVDYETGRIEFNLFAAPTNIGGEIRLDYRFLPDPFPDPYERRWTNRFRSSYAFVSLSSVDPFTSITPELSERIFFYLNELKPAHVVFEEIAVILGGSESIPVTESIPVIAILLYDPLFDRPYHGHAFQGTGNGSLAPYQRDDEEYITTYAQDALIAAGTPQAPYAYPWKRTGKFYNPLAATSATREWFGDAAAYARYDSTVTADAAPTTTVVTIADVGAIAAELLDPDAHLAFGPSADLAGEWSVITSVVAGAGFYTVTVSPALPIVPDVGDNVFILSPSCIRRNGRTLRPADTLHIYFVEDEFSGTGAQLIFGPGALSQLPISPTHVRLRFTVGAVVYEEADDGVGGFSNVSGKISSASVDYVTGAVSVTFTAGNAPDAATSVQYAYGSTTSVDLGDF